MSEERRKRKQEREESGTRTPLSRKTIIKAATVLVLAAAYFAYWYWNNHRYDAFAKCLAANHARMYGLYWCPHCIEQKKDFGASFKYVPYTECAIRGSRELAPECKAAGVKLFPSWQFGSNQPKEGVFPLDELSDKTGWALP